MNITHFWLDQLRRWLQDRDMAESLLDGRTTYAEIRVTVIALHAADAQLANSIHQLGGLAAPW